jgi:hypothetical protein
LLGYNCEVSRHAYVRPAMSISTSWKGDGALLIRCGGEELEIPADQLSGGKGGGGSGGAASPGVVIDFLPDITPGGPKVVCGRMKTVTPHVYASIDTMDGFATIVRQAMADKNPPKELVCGWNSKEEISIAEVQEIIRVQRAKHLMIQLFPMFLKPEV